MLKEPQLSFTIKNKACEIEHLNIDSVTIKYYLIDIEVLFSRNPFVESNTNEFSYV